MAPAGPVALHIRFQLPDQLEQNRALHSQFRPEWRRLYSARHYEYRTLPLRDGLQEPEVRLLDEDQEPLGESHSQPGSVAKLAQRSPPFLLPQQRRDRPQNVRGYPRQIDRAVPLLARAVPRWYRGHAAHLY